MHSLAEDHVPINADVHEIDVMFIEEHDSKRSPSSMRPETASVNWRLPLISCYNLTVCPTMNDLQAILEAFQVTSQRGEPAFLVTVVHTQGSTYRRPGARMLITQSGETIGMVSGGCLS